MIRHVNGLLHNIYEQMRFAINTGIFRLRNNTIIIHKLILIIMWSICKHACMCVCACEQLISPTGVSTSRYELIKMVPGFAFDKLR